MNRLYKRFLSAVVLSLMITAAWAQGFVPKPQAPIKRLKAASDVNQSISFVNLFTYPEGVASNTNLTTIASLTVTSDNPAVVEANATNSTGVATFARYIAKGGNITGTATLTVSIDYNGTVYSNTVTIEVAHVVANNDVASVAPGRSILIDVLANDQPVASIDGTTLEIVSGPVTSTATVVEDQGKKKILFEPASEATNYSTESFTYRVADNTGNYSSPGQVTVNINFSPYITTVYEYKPAPGQFINKTPWGTPAIATPNLVGAPNGNGVSLGGFGGYVVVGFEQPVKNNSQNRYGVDFTVSGNAFSGWTEPGSVMVMKDLNGNGLPDDTWYELAGSEYHFSRAKKINMTYINPRYTTGRDVIWETDLEEAGVLRDNTFHNQPYYPQPDIFSNVNGDRETYSGTRINIRINRSNPGLITSGSFVFGYADNKANNSTPTIPRNPYFADANGASADGFDISWAVDENGNPVELDEIHFIKIYNSAQEDAGWLGEASTEIDAVTITTPDPAWVAQDYYVQLIGSAPYQVLKGNTHTFEGLLFKNGIPQTTTGTWSVSDAAKGSIDQNGTFTSTELGPVIIQYSADDNLPLATFAIDVVELADMVVTTNNANLYVNEQTYIHAEGTDNRTAPVNRFIYDTYTYTVDDETLADVSVNGIVTAKAPGVATITVTSNTKETISKTVQITITSPPAITVAPGADLYTYAQGVTTQRIDLNTVFTVTGGGQVFSTLKENNNTHLLAASVESNRFLDLIFTDGAAGTATLTLAATAYGVTEEFSITIAVTPQSTQIKEKQIVFVNGGTFGSSAGNVQVLNPATLEVEKMADFDRAQSVQDVVADGRYVYVSAEYDIIKYDMITKTEVARRFTQDKSETEADGASEDGKGVNHSMTIYKNYLIATRQHSYDAPEDGYNVRIYNKHDLTLVKKIPVSTQASGVIAVGDSAFVALNGGFMGATGQLAIIDLVNLEKKEEFDFGADGKSIMQLFSKDKHIYALAEGKILDYIIKDRSFTRHDVGVGHADFSSSPLATVILDNKLYGKTNWDGSTGKGYGSIDLNTFTIAEDDLIGISTDEDIINNSYMVMASAYDREAERFYITYGAWWGDGTGFVYDGTGTKLGGFGNVETSPERMVVSYGITNNKPYTSALLENIALLEKESLTKNLSDYFKDIDQEVLSYSVTLEGGSALPEWVSISGTSLIVSEAPKDEEILLTIVVTATDDYNATVSQTITLTVTPVDDAPVVQNIIADVVVDQDAADYVIDLAGVFFDEDNDASEMLYNVSNNSNTSLIGTAVSGSILTLSFLPKQSGEADITVQVTSGGKTAETTFHVTVNLITSVDDELIGIRIFPNPVTTTLQIDLGESYAGSSFTLLNASGQEVKRINSVSAQEVIDMQSLPAGLYFIIVKTNRGELKRRIIKK